MMGTEARKKAESCPEACQAMCCRYVATKIDAPRTKIDWDEIYWFLCHENVEVFIESRKWYVQFDTPCRNLDAKSRCVAYPRRPHVCRDHEVENCEYWGEEDGKVSMRTTEDLKKYMKRRGIRLRMAWDDPDEGPKKKTSSRSKSRAARKPRTRRSKG
jgi:Fe-S-cluster containining protein